MRRYMTIFLVLALSVTLLVAAACAPKPEAATAEEFFRNNSVTLYVNGSVGGSTDFEARIFASFWGEATGGPGMRVEVKPGGGGTEGIMEVYNAEPDGLSMGITFHSSDFYGPPLLETFGITFDPREMSWIGIQGAEWRELVISPDKTLDDLLKKGKVKLGATNVGGAIFTGDIVFIELFDLDGEIVAGYEWGELPLAMERGEIDGWSSETSDTDFLESKGFAKPVVSGTFERGEFYPDLPAIAELVTLTPEKERLLTFLTSAFARGRSFYTTPGVPADRVDYMRRTFDKIMANPAFKDQLSRVFKVWTTPWTGEQVEKDANEVLSLPADIVNSVKDLMPKYVR